MSFEDLLNQTGTIRRFTQTGTSDYGQKQGSFQDFATNVKCRLEVHSGREVKVGDRAVISNWQLFLKAGQDVTERDKWVQDSKEYDILLVRDPGGQGHHLELDLLLVEA